MYAAHALHQSAGAEVLSGATVEIYDDQPVLYSTATTNDKGRFHTQAPRGETIFAVVSAPDQIAAGFSGSSGLSATMKVEAGALFGFAQSDMDAVRATFAGCPNADGGHAIFGEVRVSDLQDPTTGDEPLVTTGVVNATSEQNILFDACYLTDDGTAYDDTATQTGQSGRFAIFGMDPGVYELVTTYVAFGTDTYTTYQSAFIPDDPSGGAPEYPVWVDFYY